MRQRKVKNIFVMPKFQFRLIAMFMSLAAYVVVLSALLNLMLIAYFLKDSTLNSVSDVLMSPEYVNLIIVSSVAFFAFIVFITFLIGVYYSHKVAGPVYAFQMSVRKLLTGDYGYKRFLRKDDELKQFMDDLHALGDKLRAEVDQKKKSPSGDSGFSLIELLLSLALGSIVLGSITTLVLKINSYYHGVESRYNATEIYKDIERNLLTTRSCNNTLQGKILSQLDTATSDTTYLELTQVKDESNNVAFDTGKSYGSPPIAFDRLKVENVYKLNTNSTKALKLMVARPMFKKGGKDFAINLPLLMLPVLTNDTAAAGTETVTIVECNINAMSPWNKDDATGNISTTHKVGFGSDPGSGEFFSTAHNPMQILSSGHTGLRFNTRGGTHPGIYLETIKSGGMIELQRTSKEWIFTVDGQNNVGMSAMAPFNSRLTIHNDDVSGPDDIFFNLGGAEKWSFATPPTADNELVLDKKLGYGRFATEGAVVVGDPAFNPATSSYEFYVSGLAGGISAWNSPSDYRLKKDLRPVENALSRLLQVRGVSYELKKSKEPLVQWGFIAEELNRIFPELVSKNSGLWGVYLDQVVAVVVDALKDFHSLVKKEDSKFLEFKNELCSIHTKELICQPGGH